MDATYATRSTGMIKIKNIAIVVNHLAIGGAQKSAARLSLILGDLGHKVTFIALYNNIDFKFNGEFIALSRDNENIFLRGFKQFIRFRKIVKQREFDLIIDFRGKYSFYKEFLICNLIYRNPNKIVFTVRESKLDNYFAKPYFLFKHFYKKLFRIITVFDQITEDVIQKYGLTNVSTINNGYDLESLKELSRVVISDYGVFIVAVGRFVKIKQFEELIDTYLKTDLPNNGIKLLLLGDGELKDEILKKIEVLNIDDKVILIPFQKNPYKFLSKAEFLVLCSKREGFPNVLIESLACGTPVISFDCQTGPRQIIRHEENGLLVRNQDFEALKVSMDKMISDKVLLQKCKENSMSSIKEYSFNNIQNYWMKLISELDY